MMLGKVPSERAMAAMLMLGVVPSEEFAQEFACVLKGGEAFWESGSVFWAVCSVAAA
jgi:hypothetical protein